MAYGTPIGNRASVEEWEQAARQHEESFGRDPSQMLFRVEAIQPYADEVTGDGAWYVTDHRLELSTFRVLRWTPCGARLAGWSGGSSGTSERWVDLRDGHKQWASRTAAEALEQFRQRRKAQVYILKRQLRRAERELALAEGAFALEAIPA